MPFTTEESALAKKASFGDDVVSQREAAVALYDSAQPEDSAQNQPEEFKNVRLNEDLQREEDFSLESAPTWEEALEIEAKQKAGTDLEVPPTWEEALEIEQRTSSDVDAEVWKNLPDRLRVGLWSIPIDKRTAAFFVGTGAGMSWAYRGVKQLAGIDEETMAGDAKIMEDLYKSSAGGYARGGSIYGGFFEPVGLLTGAKVFQGASIASGTAKAAAVGTAYGATGYVGEGESRAVNAVMGGTLAGGLTYGIKKAANSYGKYVTGKANEQISEFEKQWAESMLRRKDPNSPDVLGKGLLTQAGKDAMQLMGKDFSLTKTSELAGRRARPPMNFQEAEDLIKFYKGMPKQNNLKVGVDDVIGIVSTRLKNLNPMIAQAVRNYDENVLGQQHKYFQQIDPFINTYNKYFSGAEKVAMDKALRNGNFSAFESSLRSKNIPGVLTQWQKVKETIDELGNLGIQHGVIKEKLVNYFPRYITKSDEMMKRLGKKEFSLIDDALKTAQGNKELSGSERSAIINKVMFGRKGNEKTIAQGFAKQRKYETVPDFLHEYYAAPEESLHTYIRNMVTDVEKYKFFGKSAKTTDLSGVQVIDLDNSIGRYINSAHTANPLTSSEQKELKALLTSRFGIGEKSPGSLVQNTKNIMYSMLLANPVSAVTQVGDVGVSVYKNGLLPTIKSLPGAITNKGAIRAQDYGLLDSLSQEFATTGTTARWLHKSFRASGFKYMDRLGKDVVLKGTYNKYSSLAKSQKGMQSIVREYTPALGMEEATQLARDLNSGKVTPLVKSMLFGKLADVQPVSLSEVPKMYLDHPNGRVMYMLKSFMLKQVDILRQDAYNEIKKGNIGKGMYNAMRYGLIVGAAGAGVSAVKDKIIYGVAGLDPPEKDLPDEIGENLFKTFGWSEYTSNLLKDGKPVQAAGTAFIPPFMMFDKLIQSGAEGNQDWTYYAPVVGKLYWTWFADGAETMLEKGQKKAEERKFKDLGLDELDEMYEEE